MNFKSQRKSIHTKFIRTKARSDDLIDYKFPLQNKRKFETNQFIPPISLLNCNLKSIFIIVWFTEDTVNSSDETRSKKSSNKNLAEVKSEQGNEVPMLK